MHSTSDEHVSPNPLGDDAATEDQVGLAGNAVATCVAVVVMLFSLVTWGTVQLTVASGVKDIDHVTRNSAAVNLLAFGTVATVFAGAIVGWILLKPVRSSYRRGGVAIVGTFAGVLVALLTTLAARWALANQGLLALLVISGIAAAFFAKRARASANSLPSHQT